MGRDSDDELALGEVGKCGVAVDTLADIEDLYRGIDLGAVTTSMTINGPAAVIFAMYVAQRGGDGRRAGAARRHAPERHPEGVPGAEGVHLPAAPVAAARRRHDARSARRRCRAGTRSRSPATTSARRDRPPREELAFTRRQRLRVRRARRCRPGSTVDAFAPRLSFFFNAHIDFFEEIAKYRAARRIWARWMRDRYGAQLERSLQMRFHTQTAGRVAHRAAARGQHRAHRDRGAGRRARRHAEPAHQLDGRDARAADREGGADRAAHAAGDRARDPRRRTSPIRSAARGTSRRSPTSSSAGPRRSSPRSTSWATARCSTARSAASRRAGTRARSPTPRTSSSAS